LEDGILSVLRQKSDLLIERRRQDIEDAVEECAGRLDTVRQSRIVEREGRRRRRKERRSKLKEPADYYEGLSSDDELLESTKMKFRAEFGMNYITNDWTFVEKFILCMFYPR